MVSTDSTHDAIQCDRLTFQTEGRLLLQDITFDSRAGSTTVILGPSGCGKSTLLKLIAGLLLPTSGTIFLDGLTPLQCRERGCLGVAFQDPALLPWKTVCENIELPLRILRKPVVMENIQEMMRKVQIEYLLDQGVNEGQRIKSYRGETYGDTLSGGEKARVALARALVNAPSFLLLDEPFGSLDSPTRRELNIMLRQLLQTQPATTIIVTHDPQEATLLADQLLILGGFPTSVQERLIVPIEGERTESLFTSHDFLSYCEDLFGTLSRIRNERPNLTQTTRATHG